MKFFSYDSKFSQVILKIAQSCYLNLLWMVFSLPVFTAGAATAALYRVTLKIARNEEPAVTKQFIRGFRADFKQATALWLILLGVGLLLGADGVVLYRLSRSVTGAPAVFWTLLLALVIAAGIAWVIVLIYVFPLVASVENTNGAMLKNAFFIGTHYLFCTILVLVIHFAMFFVVVRVFTPMIVFGEGICALLSSYLLAKVIAACSYDPNAPESGSGGDADESDADESDGAADEPDGSDGAAT